ncbi:hypothetical protein HDK77DRAFT_482317 [Phyllosticta capitalensis]
MTTSVAANAVTPPRRQQHHYMNRLENTNQFPPHNSSASSPATDTGTNFGTSPPSPSEASTAPTSYSPSVDGSPSPASNTAARYRPAQTPGHHRIPAPPIPLLQPSRPAPVPTRAQTQLSTVPKDSRTSPPSKNVELSPKDPSGKVAWSDRSRSRSLFGFRSSRNHSSRSSWGRSAGSKSSKGEPQPSTKSLSTSKSLGEVEAKKAAQMRQQDEYETGQISHDARGGNTPEIPTKSDTRAGPETSPKKGHRKRWSLATGYNAISGQNAMSPAPKPSSSTSHRDKTSTSVNRSSSFFSSNRNAAPNIAPATGTITPSTSTSSRGQASVFSRSHTRSSSANTAATTPSTISGRDMNSSTAAAAAAAAVMTSPTGFTVEPDSNPTLHTMQPEPLNISGRSAIVPDAPDTPGRTMMPSVPYAATGINAASSSTTSLTSGGGRRLRPRGFSLTGGGGGSSSPSASVGRLGSLTGGWTAGWTSGNGWSPSGWSNGLRATRQAPGSPVGGSCTANPGIVTGAVSSSVVNGYSDESPSPSGRGKSRRELGNGCELDRRRDRSNGRRGRSNSATPRPSPGSTTSLHSSPRKPSPPSDSSKPSPNTSPISNTEAFPPLSANASTTTLTSPTSPGSNLNKPWPPLPLHLRRRRASTPASPSRPRPLVAGATVPFADPPQPSDSGISTTRTTPSSSCRATPTPQTPLPQTPMSTTSVSTTGTDSTIRANPRDSQSSTSLLLPKKRSDPQPATPTASQSHPSPPKAATVPPTGAGMKQPPRRTSFSSLAAREARASFQNSRRAGSNGPSQSGSSSGVSGFSWRRTSVDTAARQNKPTTAPGSRSASRGRRSISENRGRGPSSGRASDDRGIGGVRRDGSTRTVQAAVMPALLLLGTELFTPGKRPEDVGFGRAVAAGGAVRGVGGAGKAVGVLDVDDLDDTEDEGGDMKPQTTASTRYHGHHHTTSSSSGLSFSHTPPQSTPHSRSQSSSLSYQPPPPSSSASSSTSSPHLPFSMPSKSTSSFPHAQPAPKPSLSLLPSIPQSLPQTPSPLPSNPSSHRTSRNHSHANSAPLSSTTTSPRPPSHAHTTSSPTPAAAPFVSRLDPGSTCPFTVDASSGHFDLPGSQRHGEPFRRASLSPPVAGVRDLGREGDLMAGMEAVWRKWEGAVA